MNFKEILATKKFKNLSYFLLILIMIFFLWMMVEQFKLTSFFNDIESKSYDFRVNVFNKNQIPNPNIVILAIDDDSVEMMQDEYGQWPWNRSAYKNIIDYLEKDNAELAMFDLMFVGTQKGFEKESKELAKTIANYNNVYVSMNFDFKDNKKAPDLPDKLKAILENNSNSIDFKDVEFDNVRMIMNDIVQTTDNIGIINFVRDNDGISRRAPSFLKYKSDYYPYLGLKIAQRHLINKGDVKSKKFIIDKQNKLILGNRKIQLDENGYMILNWAQKKDFKEIPAWKVFQSIQAEKEGKSPSLKKDFFKDKIVFIGVTATSLYDIKSTPLEKVYAGVKVQATAVDNIINNNPVKRVKPATDIMLSLILLLITGIITLRTKSAMINSFAVILLGVSYFIFTGLMFQFFDYWISLVYPLITIAITFTTMYIIKFINKSKDFDYTYKLATTDGLTELYNHRYFQEQMINNIETCKRYGSNFSLVLIDIDFFKKFNDMYGHQSGDAVLKQVAALLKKSVRATDIVCRYGGEEMSIILPNTNLDEAYITANKICEKVAEKLFKMTDGNEKNVTISLGVATYPIHGQKPSEMIEFSDKGLYAAKENGRNQVGKIPGYEPKTTAEVKTEK